MAKVFIPNLMQRLGRIRSFCDGGHNEDARQACFELENDITTAVEGLDPAAITGAEELSLEPVPVEDDEEQPAPDADATKTDGPPPVPGSPSVNEGE